MDNNRNDETQYISKPVDLSEESEQSLEESIAATEYEETDEKFEPPSFVSIKQIDSWNLN